MSVKIRPMTKNDWEDISNIYTQGIESNISTLQPVCPSYSEWDATHLTVCRLVITDNDIVAGWAALSSISSRYVYSGVAEDSIYIKSEFHGNGLGKHLLNELILQSEKDGIWTLQAGILEDNHASIALHKSCGFRMVGFRERIGRDRCGKWRNTVLMERRSQIIGG